MHTEQINTTILANDPNRLSARDRAAVVRRARQAEQDYGILDTDTLVTASVGPLLQWWPEATARRVARAILGIQNDSAVMTLWDAYRTANRRRASLSVSLAPDAGLGNGQTERSLRVSAHLVGGMVAVQQGLNAQWTYVDPQAARAVEVTR